VVERLEWDSAFWGLEVGEQRDGGGAGDDLVADLERFAVVQARVDLREPGRARRLAAHGFFPVDSRVVHRLALDDVDALAAPGPSGTWTAQLDRTQARRYAHDFVPFSRFRAFPAPTSRVVDFYQTWIERAAAGAFDDGLLHLVIAGSSAGFVTYRIRGSEAAVGLLAVGAAHRGQGVLRALLARTFEVARPLGARSLDIATEGTNHRARRAYARAGFRLASDTLWMYRVR
jgi:RimJ/RimL family protein N-acetyltransferase